MATKKTKQWTIAALASAFLMLVAVIGGAEKVAATADPYIVTEAEAAVSHNEIEEVQSDAEQTQAGFNAYTLKQILLQEVEILKLKIASETDPAAKEILQLQLQHKMEFITGLENEARRQLLKKKETA